MATMVKTYIFLCIVGLCTTLFVMLIMFGDNQKPIPPPQLHLRKVNNLSRRLTLDDHNFPLLRPSKLQEHGKENTINMSEKDKVSLQRILHQNDLQKVGRNASNQLSQRMLKENHPQLDAVADQNSRYFEVVEKTNNDPAKYIVKNMPSNNAQHKQNDPPPQLPQIQQDANLPDKQQMINQFQEYHKHLETVKAPANNNKNSNNSVAHIHDIGNKVGNVEAVKNVPPVTDRVEEIVKTIQPKVGNTRHCTAPQNNIALLKTHKCSSSTLQNILYRWGDAKNLSFVLPKGGMPYLGSPSLFDIKYAIQADDGVYNILANHARFNEKGLAEVMPPGTVYITIIRNPTTQYESLYNYYKHQGRYGVTLNQFLTNPTGYFHTEPLSTHIVGRNSMLFDLGLDARYMEGTDPNVNRWIQMLDNKFSLVLIAEYFAESLILLKEILCWTMDDIVFLNQNARSASSVTKLTPFMQQGILKWNSADTQLYRFFNQTLWRKIEAYGLVKMKQEVAVLKAKNEALTKDCVAATLKSGDPRMWYPPGVKMESFKLNPSAKNKVLCDRVTHPELTYMKLLADKQRKRNSG